MALIALEIMYWDVWRNNILTTAPARPGGFMRSQAAARVNLSSVAMKGLGWKSASSGNGRLGNRSRARKNLVNPAEAIAQSPRQQGVDGAAGGDRLQHVAHFRRDDGVALVNRRRQIAIVDVELGHIDVEPGEPHFFDKSRHAVAVDLLRAAEMALQPDGVKRRSRVEHAEDQAAKRLALERERILDEELDVVFVDGEGGRGGGNIVEKGKRGEGGDKRASGSAAAAARYATSM